MATAQFAGRYENLEKICRFVEDAARAAGFGEQAVYAVQSAVDEACSNIILHAYGGEGKGVITCSTVEEPDALIVTLHDTGRPFDPENVPEPDLDTDLENVKIGGLGLYFIRRLMDDVRFDFDPTAGNTLTMVKRKEKRV